MLLNYVLAQRLKKTSSFIKNNLINATKSFEEKLRFQKASIDLIKLQILARSY